MYDTVMGRLKIIKSRNISNTEDQVERVLAITRLVQRRDGVNLLPNNPIAKEILDISIVREHRGTISPREIHQ